MNVILSGVVGSTAYGLAGPDSDVDRLGMFAAPTVEFHGLHRPKESIVTTDPDVTFHEAGKWCRLALGCNPTAMELVWLDSYETRTELGAELIGIRTEFLSQKRVRDAYLGYATQQFKRLSERGDGSFSANTRLRTAKHARHLARLCHQCVGLWLYGTLTIRLSDPDWYRWFGDAVAAGDLDVARDELSGTEQILDCSWSELPERPNEGAVEAWLRKVRLTYLET